MKTNLRNRGLGLVAFLSLATLVSAQGADGRTFIPRGQGPNVQWVRGKVGDWIMAGPARYRVVGVTSGLRSYREQYSQSGKKLHPGFSSDRLAVIELEVTNQLQRPIEPPVFMVALTDSDGVRGTDWILDARHQAFLEESTRGGRSMSRTPAEIAAGQTMKLALVFSVSAKALPTMLEFSPENFRDMPFGQPGRYRPLGGGAPADGRVGPRPSAQTGPPRDPIRVAVDLTHRK